MKPHHIVVTDAPGQPRRMFDYPSRRAALSDACRIFENGPRTVVVQVYEGTIADRSDADPVQVFG